MKKIVMHLNYKIVLLNIDLIELFHIFTIFIFISNVNFQFQSFAEEKLYI